MMLLLPLLNSPGHVRAEGERKWVRYSVGARTNDTHHQQFIQVAGGLHHKLKVSICRWDLSKHPVQLQQCLPFITPNFLDTPQAEQVSMDNTHNARAIHHTSSGRAAATAGVDVNPRWNIVRNFLTSWCGSATHAGTAWELRQRPGSCWKARGIVDAARTDIRLMLRLARPAEERTRAPRRGMLDSMPTRRHTRRKDIITATAAPASVVPWFDQ